MRSLLILALSSMICSAIMVIPRPKEITDEAAQWTFGLADAWVIVLGAASDSVEAYAASMLQSDISKRFGKNCAISKENECPSGYSLTILLGKRGTHTLLDQICSANSYPLYADTPGVHGFIIRMLDQGGMKTVLIGSMDNNGAIYGQNTFFQLLSKSLDTVAVNLADIRDWPSIKDRGCAYFRYTDFLRNGALDAYVRGRLNYVDIRGSCGAYTGCSGTDRVSDIDSVKAATLSREAHQRGFFVWGTVKCGIGSTAEIPGRLDIFRHYQYSWGADGLWASYDDAGSCNSAELLLNELIHFADSVGLARDRIRIVPPSPDYCRVDAPWNDTIISRAPETKTIRWIWTDNPGPSKLATAESMGFLFKPEWWWNWPRPGIGFTHSGYYGVPVGDSMMYNELLPLQNGWRWGWEPNPDFESAAMRESWKYMHSALFWAPDLQNEYLAMGFGLWAWCPEQYYFNEVRQYIWETVFGDKWAAAQAFDSSLAQLRDRFDVSAPRPWPLKTNTPRYQAESLAVECAKQLAVLRTNQSTLLDSLRYLERYIAPMEKAVRTAHEYLGLSYVPDTNGENQGEMERKTESISLQVMPNPFNPAANIMLTTMGQLARISIFYLSGEKVTDLRYVGKELVWNASVYPSGVYFIRAEIGSKVLLKKAVLLR